MASRTRRGGGGPYKGRSGPDLDIGALESSLLGPAAGRVDGYEARGALNEQKRYRCPYCEGWIAAGLRHTVALPAGRPQERRHYHTACWANRAKQIRGGRRSPV